MLRGGLDHPGEAAAVHGSTVVPSGHTVLHLGDEVTLVATPDSVGEVRMRRVG